MPIESIGCDLSTVVMFIQLADFIQGSLKFKLLKPEHAIHLCMIADPACVEDGFVMAYTLGCLLT
jgi:hypothetical protein